MLRLQSHATVEPDIIVTAGRGLSTLEIESPNVFGEIPWACREWIQEMPFAQMKAL